MRSNTRTLNHNTSTSITLSSSESERSKVGEKGVKSFILLILFLQVFSMLSIVTILIRRRIKNRKGRERIPQENDQQPPLRDSATDADKQTKEELEKERDKVEERESTKVAFESFLPYPNYSIFSAIYFLISRVRGRSVSELDIPDPRVFLDQSIVSIQQVFASLSRNIHPSLFHSSVSNGSVEDASYLMRRVIGDTLGVDGDEAFVSEGYNQHADITSGACFKDRAALLTFCKTGIKERIAERGEPGVYPSPINRSILHFPGDPRSVKELIVPQSLDPRFRTNGSAYALGKVRIQVPDDESLIRSVVTKRSRDADEIALRDWVSFFNEEENRKNLTHLIKAIYTCSNLPISVLSSLGIDTEIPNSKSVFYNNDGDGVVMFLSNLTSHRGDLTANSQVHRYPRVNGNAVTSVSCSVSEDSYERIVKWLYLLSGYSLNQFRLDEFNKVVNKGKVLHIDISQALGVVQTSAELRESIHVGFLASQIRKGLVFLPSEFSAIDHPVSSVSDGDLAAGTFHERGNEAVRFPATVEGLKQAKLYRQDFLRALYYSKGNGCSHSRYSYQDVIQQFTEYKDASVNGKPVDDRKYPSPYTLLVNNESDVIKSIEEFCTTQADRMREEGINKLSRPHDIEKLLMLMLKWFSIPLNSLSERCTRFYPSSTILAIVLSLPEDVVIQDMKNVGLDPDASYQVWDERASDIDDKYRKLFFSSQNIERYTKGLLKEAVLKDLLS